MAKETVRWILEKQRENFLTLFRVRTANWISRDAKDVEEREFRESLELLVCSDEIVCAVQLFQRFQPCERCKLSNFISTEIQTSELADNEADLVYRRDAVERSIDAGKERRVLKILESAQSISGYAQAAQARKQQERWVHYVKRALCQV